MSQATLEEQAIREMGPYEGKVTGILGVFMVWKLTSADTNGHYCVIEMTVPPGAGLPLHQHEAQEAFYVLEGRAEFGRMGENGPEWLPLATGSIAQVPSHAIHGFRNSGTLPARILLTCTPEIEAFFEEAGVPVQKSFPLIPGTQSAVEVERVHRLAVKHGLYFLPNA